MSVETRFCSDVDDLAGAECCFGTNIGRGEAHSKLHFTPFQVDEDSVFMWTHLILCGGIRCSTPNCVDGMLVPEGCGV